MLGVWALLQMAEALSIYHGLVMMKKGGIKSATVLGDSSIIVQHLQCKTTLQNVFLARLIQSSSTSRGV